MADKGQLTRVIEFSGLTNTETTTANNQHLLDVHEVPSASNGTAVQVGLGVGSLGGGAEGGKPGEGAKLLGLNPRRLALPQREEGLRSACGEAASRDGRSSHAALAKEVGRTTRQPTGQSHWTRNWGEDDEASQGSSSLS